jgi:hypothetical protein
MLNRARAHVPHVEREGVCAWCGLTVFGAVEAEVVWCPRCRSEEIDWCAPPKAAPPPSTPYTRDAQYLPGMISLSVLGAKVHGRH